MESFLQYHPQLRESNVPEGRTFLDAITIFGIPWIWRWDIQIGTNDLGLPILQRIYQYRWWKGAKMEKTIVTIKSKNQELRQQQQENFSIKIPFLEIPAQIRAKNPSLSDNEIVIKTMDFMKDQFLQSVHKVADDESMTSAKSNEEDNNPFACLAGESQNPYEDEGNTPTLGDF